MTVTEQRYAHPAERVLRPNEQDLAVAWRDLVEANAAQLERLWETRPAGDQWGSGYGTIQVDPENPSFHSRALIPLARPDESWLDIGAGFGGTILPLARHVRRVTAVDPSPGMTQLLKNNVQRLGIENVDVLPPEMCPPAGRLEKHDVSLAALVVYEVPNICEFLDAMEQHASRLCVALVAELGCGFTPPEPVFELVHGEPYIRPPALREFLAVLSARRRRFDITAYPIPSSPEDLDEGLRRWWRRTFLVAEGTEKDARLRELLIEHYGIGDSQIEIAGNFGRFTALITWEPPAS